MKEEGIEDPSNEDARQFDKKRKGRKVSKEEWKSNTDRDSRIAKMKEGRTYLAYKAEHAVDMDMAFRFLYQRFASPLPVFYVSVVILMLTSQGSRRRPSGNMHGIPAQNAPDLTLGNRGKTAMLYPAIHIPSMIVALRWHAP